MFNERKVAQMAAFFLDRAPRKTMPHLKLMKLLYLSDREAMRAYGWTISEDRLVSMPHGPVLSQTLNLMDGDAESQPGGWTDWISAKENNEVSLRRPFNAVDLDELSPAHIDVLNAVWDKFGAMGKWEIRDWTHQHCAEWQDPKGSSVPIQYETLARAVGFDDEVAKEISEEIQERENIDELFAAL
jgi:uncharacterized phage-associated protein